MKKRHKHTSLRRTWFVDQSPGQRRGGWIANYWPRWRKKKKIEQVKHNSQVTHVTDFLHFFSFLFIICLLMSFKLIDRLLANMHIVVNTRADYYCYYSMGIRWTGYRIPNTETYGYPISNQKLTLTRFLLFFSRSYFGDENAFLFWKQCHLLLGCWPKHL